MFIMKKLLSSFFLALFFFLTIVHGTFAETINDFYVVMKIGKDGTVDVIENIRYDFGYAERHGIFRNIPYVKTNKDGKRYKLKIDVTSVVDEKGNSYNFKTSTDVSDKEIEVKIGDPNVYVTGKHNYVINYKVYGALTYFSDHDELYWNVTGDEWTVPIEKAGAQLVLPQAVQENNLQKQCFTGPSGSTESACGTNVEEESVVYRTDRSLYGGEGFTVVVGFPKGMVDVLEPQPYVEFQDTWYGKIIIFLIVFGIGLIIFLWYIFYPIWIMIKWYRHGRDPKVPMGETRAWYDPPKTRGGRSLTPAESGALVDEVVDLRDISATIVDLARRGYLKIEEKKKNDFYFHRTTKNKGVSLLPFESSLLNGIFGSDTSIRVKDEKLYTEISQAKTDVYKLLVEEGFFPKDPSKIRNFYIGIGVAGLMTMNIPLAVVAFTFGISMPAKTALGASAAAVARSLKNFLSSQERQLKFQASKQLMFERLLPFAVAFGVESIWAERFKDLHLKKPDWYSSYDSSGFRTTTFTHSLNSSFKNLSYAATPTSSSSGFSSGSSGGSSGGGGGGGGGGSW